MKGFFSVEPTKTCNTTHSLCGKCGLYKKCKSPKMPYTGNGREGILIVAEAPGITEDERGIQLVGNAGQKLREVLHKVGVDLDTDCWKTNSVICYPGKDQTPTDNHVDCCRPNLLRTIKELNPRIIILLGGVAVDSLISHLWRPGENVGSISTWAGWHIPSRALNAWICPTWHPSYLLHENDSVLELWFRKHLEDAVSLVGRPWEIATNENPYNIDMVFDGTKAASVLRKMVEKGGKVAFDYETDRLKPDHNDASIYSCAVCWNGTKTIAYPWHGDAIAATRELLVSSVEKIGWNIKFEQRWTKKIFGHGVRNWIWDGMQAAHILDNRKSITSAKFQSFVLLGISAYDTSVHPYLESVHPGANSVNRIRELNTEMLLRYNGMDAVVEYKMFEIQQRELELLGL